MSQPSPPRRVFRLPLRLSRVAREVDEELRFHVEMRREDLLREGWSEEDAEREAWRQFGDVKRVRDECRRIGMRRTGEMRIADWMDGIRHDVGFALRQFVRAPAFSLLAVVTLALGIGATTIVFSVVNSVVLEAVPFDDPDELVMVREVTPQGSAFSSSEPNYLDWTRRQRSFAAMGAYTMGDMTLTGAGEAQRVSGLRVTHGVLPLLGIDPLLGRHFAPKEDTPESGDRVVLLAEGFWDRRFGADPDILNETLVLDGVPHVVVGVVPTDRGFPDAEIFTPLRPDPASDRGNHMIQTMARLAPGTTLEDANRDMGILGEQLAAEYPDANPGWGAMVQSLQDWRVGDRLTRIALFLMIAVGLLLLMACGSVATILVARATGRQREIGLRAALGAGRSRIVSQLLTESAVLGIVGGGLGVLLARVGTPAVRALGPGSMARLDQASVDGRVLLVALMASAVSVVAFGLAPALFATRGRLFDALREGAATLRGGQRRLRDALVAGQFALAVVVVLGAGLLTRSFSQIQDVDLGFSPEGGMMFTLSLPNGEYTDGERVDFLAQFARGIEGLPGVEVVGVTMSSPFSPFQASNMVAAADDVPDRQEDFLRISWRAVDEGYLDALGAELLRGRGFHSGDRPPPVVDGEMADGYEPPVIVDERLAQHLWGTQDVVGQAVVWGDAAGITMRIVGVVRSVRDEWVQDEPRPRLYLPYALFAWPSPAVMVRSGSDPSMLVPAIRNLLAGMDPDVPMMDVATLPEATAEAVAWPRFTMQVVAGFGLVAIILAAMGIYGVAAFGVVRMRREIGIRIAMGSEPRGVVGLVLRRTLRLAVAGIALGVLGAFAGGNFIRSLLYGVEPNDPLTFVTIPAALAAIALLAAWIPARRATKVDPRDALTAE